MKYSLHAAKLIDAYLTLAALGNVYGAEDVREAIAYLNEHRWDVEGPEGAEQESAETGN